MIFKVLRILWFIGGLVLVIDCAILMTVGKINFGTVVPFMLGVIFIIHSLFLPFIRALIIQKSWLSRAWYGLWALFSIWLISFTIFVGLLQQQITSSEQPLPQVAAIIILGAGSMAGQPTPTLAARLDSAVSVIKSQPQAVVVTSGGVGFNQTASEADVMASYLHKTHGISLARILQEEASTSTEENLLYSQAILKTQAIALVDPIAIVTSDFHTIRSAAIARHQGYQQPIMVASSTPLSIRYNAWFREYFAFVSGWILGEY